MTNEKSFSIKRILTGAVLTGTIALLAGCGSAPKAQVDGPDQTSRLSHPYGPLQTQRLDPEVGERTVTAAKPDPKSPTEVVTSAHKYQYETDKEIVTYAVKTPYTINRVKERNSYIGFVEGNDENKDLYEVTDGGALNQLTGGKPVVDLDTIPARRPSAIAANSTRVGFKVDRADSENMHVTRTYQTPDAEELVIDQYSLEEKVPTAYVARQKGRMAIIEDSDRPYWMDLNSGAPVQLEKKPTVALGEKPTQEYSSDSFSGQYFHMISNFGDSWVGNLRNYYKRPLQFEVEQYFVNGGQVKADHVIVSDSFFDQWEFISGNDYYQVGTAQDSDGDQTIQALNGKPTATLLSERGDTISSSDGEYFGDRDVSATQWYGDDQLTIHVKQHFVHQTKYVNVLYWTHVDVYSSYDELTYNGWSLNYGGRVYWFDVDESGYSAPGVVVIHVPSYVRERNTTNRHRRYHRPTSDDSGRPGNTGSSGDDSGRPANTGSRRSGDDSGRPANTSSVVSRDDSGRPSNTSTRSSSYDSRPTSSSTDSRPTNTSSAASSGDDSGRPSNTSSGSSEHHRRHRSGGSERP